MAAPPPAFFLLTNQESAWTIKVLMNGSGGKCIKSCRLAVDNKMPNAEINSGENL